ncbi:Protein of unknown function [Mesorhizobium albiziae]|uniref:DUF1403 family protein n=2 Tax=Neomesorhizobium albiziae TaxID=335020 RepID=A0A1I4F3Q4_9HYPH|nr:Protein of unknown function [Mesorhizobium albiziae]
MPMRTVPTWLRKAIPDAQSLAAQGLEDVAFVTGAAVGALDAVVRRQERWSGAGRQRLALSAAALTVRAAGRVEDESQLRDSVLLTKSGDDVGPAGRMVLAWRRLTARPAEELLTEKNLAAVLEEFGYPQNDEAVLDLASELRQLSVNAGTVATLTGAFMAAERHGFGRAVGAWFADALLAQRLGWTHAVPLLGSEAALALGSARSRRSATASPAVGAEMEADRTKSLLAAQARAALRSIDLSAELGRRAEKLLAVAPKLRSKGADAIVDRLLNEDALVASRGDKMDKKMSDRGLRRLFDRLVDLGAIRELSGRPTFRIYGL